MLMYKVVYLLRSFWEVWVYQMKVVTGDFILHLTTVIRQRPQSEYVRMDRVGQMRMNYSCMVNVIRTYPFRTPGTQLLILTVTFEYVHIQSKLHVYVSIAQQSHMKSDSELSLVKPRLTR